MSDPQLSDFNTTPRWVAWRTEIRNGKPTKVPFFATGRTAQSNNPDTWLPRDQAVVVEKAIVNGLGGGVGIVLGPWKDQYLVGVDLDTCRDPSTKLIEPWAGEIIKQFNSYTEVSPSGTGVKIFARINLLDVSTIREAMGREHGRSWKRPSDNEHPAAIELHISSRYFAVTDAHLTTAPMELRSVSVTDMLWLIKIAGPRFVGKATGNSTDNSRSAVAFRLGMKLCRQGKTFDEMVAALHADPTTSDWAKEKGEVNNQRELHRIWQKAEQKLDGFSLTEDGVALAFAAKFADQLLCCHHTGRWYEWVGTHWRQDETKLAFHWARNMCRQQANGASAMSKVREAAAVERFAQADRLFAVTSERWDKDIFLLGTPDGTVDLMTGELRPAAPADYISKQTKVGPADTEDCPIWLKFLDEATRGDQTMVDFLQRWFGYCLTGDVREEALLFAWGPGGKEKAC